MKSLYSSNASDELINESKLMLTNLTKTSNRFYFFLLFLSIGLGYFLYNFYLQFTKGHMITGLGTEGAIWGIIVANVIHFIGISHVGIAISAVVRIMRLERYKQLARIAELVTLASLTTAVLNITIDVGRPEKFIFYVAFYGNWSSPFVWSMTVITTYLVGSSIYLYLAMRRDIYLCSKLLPKWSRLFTFLSFGYVDTEENKQRHEKVVWWLAVVILPIMVSVHSVYGYVFGLLAGRPGWFNPVMAPYFVLGAIVSGFSAIIIVAAILRKVFHWEKYFPPRLFKGLGIFLGFVTLLYIYFLFSEFLTGLYAAPQADNLVFKDIVAGKFSYIFLPTFFLGLFIPFWLLFYQGVNPKVVSIKLTVFCSILINLALWFIRFLIVIPTYSHPHLPTYTAHYSPSLPELSLMFGTVIFCIFFYSILIKILPILELPKELQFELERVRATPVLAKIKMPLIRLSAAVGTFLIFAGILFATRTAFGSPVAYFVEESQSLHLFIVKGIIGSPIIWLSGILILLSIPIQICFIKEKNMG